MRVFLMEWSSACNWGHDLQSLEYLVGMRRGLPRASLISLIRDGLDPTGFYLLSSAFLCLTECRSAVEQGLVTDTWQSTLRISEWHSSSTHFCRTHLEKSKRESDRVGEKKKEIERKRKKERRERGEKGKERLRRWGARGGRTASQHREAADERRGTARSRTSRSSNGGALTKESGCGMVRTASRPREGSSRMARLRRWQRHSFGSRTRTSAHRRKDWRGNGRDRLRSQRCGSAAAAALTGGGWRDRSSGADPAGRAPTTPAAAAASGSTMRRASGEWRGFDGGAGNGVEQRRGGVLTGRSIPDETTTVDKASRL
ncbi:hypothetical protein Syun_027939 [Stephania yunnanensis]|uniref:Uncharacterized protein n=1 Tax=Stephania yunnanensis TaxID=152371 RepID=A0AAP0HLH1_9MAGN